MDKDEIAARFSYQPSNSARQVTHDVIRQCLRTVAHTLNGELPDCREKSLAITKLEEAMFWANAAVARHG